MRQIGALEAGYYHSEITARIHDMPIGDAFKGPAYGEYEKSKALGMIIGIVASVATMGAALPMLAGTIGMQIAGGVMMAGGVMTGVGAITGNKKLMKIGGILSLAGGIGGAFASSAAEAGVAATGLNSSGSEALATFAKNAGGSIDSVLGTSIGAKATEYANMTYGAAGAASDAGAVGLAEAAAPAAPVEQAMTADAGSAAGLPPQQGGYLNDALATKAPFAQADGAVPLAGADAAQQSVVTEAAGAAGSNGSKGILQGGLDFLKENKELAKIGGDMIGKFAEAGFSPDQQGMIDAQTAQYGAMTAKLNNENILLAYQDANRRKQVALISENDPNKAAKIAAATAAGHGVTLIPTVGTPQPVPGQTPMTNAQTIQAANPGVVRQPTFPLSSVTA